MYEYRVTEALGVVDGDTVDCVLSLGFGLRAAFRFRVARVDAPEMRGRNAEPAGAQAKEFTRDWLTDRAGQLVARTEKSSDRTVGIGDGAFGRWLADFRAGDESLTEALIAAGFHRERHA